MWNKLHDVYKKYYSIKKDRNYLTIGDVFKDRNKLYTCVGRKTIKEGVGYGDIYDVHICKETDEKFNILENGETINILIGFTAEFGNGNMEIVKEGTDINK